MADHTIQHCGTMETDWATVACHSKNKPYRSWTKEAVEGSSWSSGVSSRTFHRCQKQE